LAGKPLTLQALIRSRQDAGFVGRERQLIEFHENSALSVDDPNRRFLVNIHGDAGVGKTFLIKRLCQNSASEGALTALVDENAEDVVAVMKRIADEFASVNVRLTEFDKRLVEYRQRRHELESDPNAPDGVAAFVTKTAVTVAFAAARDIPVAGSLLAPVNPAAVADQANRARVYLARKFGDRSDVHMLLHPDEALTSAFVAGLNRVTGSRPIALFFDTYERTAPMLDRWLTGLYAGSYGPLPATLITTIAGQYPLDTAAWGDYSPVIADVPLEPFSEDEARQFLAGKNIRDEPTIDVILKLSGRLPMWLVTLADARPRDAADVGDPAGNAVSRFLKWEPDPARRAIAVAAALPRAFNRDVVNAVAPSQTFDWLCSMPFVAQQGGFWRYHGVVRSAMLRLQHAQSPSDWRASHLALAAAHRRWAAEVAGDAAEAWSNQDWIDHIREQTYHLLCADPVNNLGQALASAINAAACGSVRARQWATLIGDAGRDCDNAGLRTWAARLTSCLDDGNLVSYLTFLIDDGDLDDKALAAGLQERGEIHQVAVRYEEALRDFTSALSIDPELSPAMVRRGHCYRMMGRYGAAIADFSQVIERDAASIEAIQGRGVSYYTVGRYHDALGDFDRAIALDPRKAESFAIRGFISVEVGSWKDALANFDRVWELNSTDAWAIVIRGMAHMMRSQIPEALAEYDRAIQMDPGSGRSFAMRGIGYLLTGRHSQALADFGRAIELDPSDASPLSGRAYLYYTIGRYNDALADVNRCVELGYNTSQVIVNRGFIYMALERYSEALADFTHAAELAPDGINAIVGLGSVYATMGRHEEALSEFNRAIELAPDNHAIFAGRATAYRNMGRLDESLADFDRAVELAPDNAFVLAGRGSLYIALGRHDEAHADFEKASEIAPDNSTVLIARASSYLVLGRHEEAIADFDSVLKLSPDNLAAIGGRGGAYLAMRRFEDAIAEFTRAIQIDPKNVTMIASRGAACEETGRLEDALSDFSRALKLDSASIELLVSRAGIYNKLRRHDEALSDSKRAVALDPSDVRALNVRGASYLAKSKYTDALADFSSALEIEPDNVRALAGRGAAHCATRRFGEGLDDFDHALDIDPRNVPSLVGRGAVYSSMDRYGDALAEFDHALEIEPDNVTALDGRAETHLLSGRYDEARRDYRRAAELDPKTVSNVAGTLAPAAIRMLETGRSEEAAGLFRALSGIFPDDAMSLNNYGFCILPTDPAAAVEALKRSEALSGKSLVTTANLVLALHQAGRDSEALALAAKLPAQVPPTQSPMWLCRKDHSLQLAEVEVRAHLRRLVTHIHKRL
jgi:tetratricopeptide (TPR) repeat protein